jgi:hypothetical protein
MDKVEKLSEEFDKVFDNMTDAALKNWFDNRLMNKQIRRKRMQEKANKHFQTISL